MLCRLCHQRDATVHLTQKFRGQPDKKLDLCTICFPLDRSEEEEAKTIEKLFKNYETSGNRRD